jgi:hypothetical protein
MTAATITRPSLREILLDALEDAYWYQKGEVEDCGHCRRSLTGACTEAGHQNALALALDYEAARKQIQDSPEAISVLAGLDGAAPAAGNGGGSWSSASHSGTGSSGSTRTAPTPWFTCTCRSSA